MEQFESCSTEQAIDSSQKASQSQVRYLKRKALRSVLPYTEVSKN